jgi:4-hydroxybenzoate polyprenyltransferase
MESVMDTPTSPVARTVVRDRLQAYARFLKLEHTLFSLPILFAGAALAGGRWPDARVTVLILVAGTAARVLALSLNRLIDRRLDGRNPRTASRELATGALSVWDAALVSVASLLAYVWAANELSVFCLIWSWVPVVFFVIYPTLKRFTWFSHFGLGLTWALAPLGGWFAVRPGLDGLWPALVLAAFSFFWLSGFDIIYATLDEDFDRREGLFSIPARLGRHRALQASSALHGAAFLCLALLYAGFLSGVGAAFLLIMAGFLLFLEHILSDHVDLAFFKINAVTGFVVLGMVLLGVRADF